VATRPTHLKAVLEEHAGRLAGRVKEINESGVPMYVWGSRFGSFTKDCLLIYRNSAGLKKRVMGLGQVLKSE